MKGGSIILTDPVHVPILRLYTEYIPVHTNTCTNSKVLNRVHASTCTNSKVLDRVHTSTYQYMYQF